MQITKFLEAVNTPDPDALINKLQDFFQKINDAGAYEAMNLVSLYSTADTLLANGMNERTVKVIKMSVKAKMIALYKKYPHTVKPAATSLTCLIETDPSLGSVERAISDLL